MLFYWIAFSNVTRSMRAEAYIEARQLLDKNLRTNLETLYYLTLLSCILLIAFSVTNPDGLLFLTAIVAMLALIGDILISLRSNIPLNKKMNAWSVAQYPENWHKYRSHWMHAFRMRQWLSVLGFVALVGGYVFA